MCQWSLARCDQELLSKPNIQMDCVTVLASGVARNKENEIQWLAGRRDRSSLGNQGDINFQECVLKENLAVHLFMGGTVPPLCC